jgi:hypothetical protein
LTIRRNLAGLIATLTLAIGALLAPSAASGWAPVESATIHPGVMTFTDGGQCTSNFVFQDANGVYLGQAAHCSGTGAATETNGCESGSLPVGTQVEINGASQRGVMVYNSWIAMQQAGETDANTCAYNDFALVRIDPADVASVNPSVPGFGGPTGVGQPGSLGATVYTYGNSSLRLGVTKLSPKQGVLVQNKGGGWSHDVYTATPGIPGDSGSGFLNASGQAFGTLSTVALAPFPASNGVGNLSRELAYMRAHSSFTGVNLVPGTRAFNPNWVQAITDA